MTLKFLLLQLMRKILMTERTSQHPKIEEDFSLIRFVAYTGPAEEDMAAAITNAKLRHARAYGSRPEPEKTNGNSEEGRTFYLKCLMDELRVSGYEMKAMKSNRSALPEAIPVSGHITAPAA